MEPKYPRIEDMRKLNKIAKKWGLRMPYPEAEVFSNTNPYFEDEKEAWNTRVKED